MTTATHKFELAGLGLAPFRYRGSYRSVGPIKLADGSEVGAPGQPMGTCAYCLQGIAICCQVESSDGKRFIVGTDCASKIGDAGLKRQVQSDVRKDAKAREVVRIAEMQERVATDSKLQLMLSSMPHPKDYRAERGETLLDSVLWMFRNAGHSGKLTTVRQIEKLIKA